MSKSTPSLLALLGIVALAGYQNRNRISDMLADARQSDDAPGSPPTARGGFLAEIGQLFRSEPSGGVPGGSTVARGLSDLVDRFRGAGRGDAADSWVSGGANRPIDVDELAAALGPATLEELGRKTGLSQAELLLRLNVALPEVVDRLTPAGRLPTASEALSIG
jgi:uncharacterized protein YidB (DUF937 family)